MALKKETIEIEGKEYTFTSLPMRPDTLALTKRLDKGDGLDRLEALLLMLEKSLRYEQTEEEIDNLFNSGAVNDIFINRDVDGTDKNKELREKVISSVVTF